MRRTNPMLITPSEAAKMLGKVNPATIMSAMRLGTFPFGVAYKTETGRWVYDIPRKPFEEYIKTGRVSTVD